MKLVVISNPENFANEADQVQQLFNAGLETFHLRKPNSTLAEFEKTLTQLSPAGYKRIVIHQHYKLVEKYNLKGIHLTAWFMKNTSESELKQLISIAGKRRLMISGSFHSIEALEATSLKLHYAFLSPLFNSISKKDYPSGININDASIYLKKKRSFEVVALGGIDESNIQQVKEAGFDGAALLGCLWNDRGEPLTKYQIIQQNIINS
jgi:thiamine-phosphate pyrophosphorylase